ncbi:MAG: cation:proton antiporter, partial [Egibacteraceae bacterium]
MAAATAGGAEVTLLFVELGAVVVGMALIARLASWTRFSPIPLYLLAGLAFGDGGLLPLRLSEQFVEVGAEIGVLLLLFMLGLEYTAEELASSLRGSFPAGVVDAALNFVPGLLAGFLLGFQPLAAVLLGGVTYVTSSGIAAKTLADLGRLGNHETPAVLSILVMEDLAMAVYLPIVAVLLVGSGAVEGLVAVTVAVVAVAVVLTVALRFGEPVSRAIHSHDDEVVLLTTFGLVLLVAGIAQRLQVSSAVGAFLVGIALSGPVAERARTLLEPLRDLFAAVFFLLFGLQVDPASIPPVAAAALALGLVTTATKLATGWWAA